MHSSRHFVLTSVLIGILLLTGTIVTVSAAGQPQLKKGTMNIGVVNLAAGPSYYFEAEQYRNFYPRYHAMLDRIGRKHNVNFIFYSEEIGLGAARLATHQLIALGVDGIVFFQQVPGAAAPFVREAQAAGVPALVHGMRPAPTTSVPYVGFADYRDSVALGKQVANRFLEGFAGKTAKVLILSSASAPMDTSRERGFVDGFRSLVPGAVVVTRKVDISDEQISQVAAYFALLGHRDTNVIFATGDTVAFGAMAALRRLTDAASARVILASAGGSPQAMQELIDPHAPWKAEEALSVSNAARETFRVMMALVHRNISPYSDRHFLVQGPIFVDPTKVDVERYLREDFGIHDLSIRLATSYRASPLAENALVTSHD